MFRFSCAGSNSLRLCRILLPLFLLVNIGPLVHAASPYPIILAPTVVANSFKNGGGIAFDSLGNLYVADDGNGAVEEVLAVNGVIPVNNPVIKTLSSSFSAPYDVAVDSMGNVFVVDYDATSVFEIQATSVGVFPDTPTIRTLGPNINLASSTAIAVDSMGNLFVGSQSAQSVVEIQATSVGVYPDAPTIKILDASFVAQYPDGIAVDSKGNLFVADSNTNALSEIAATSVGVYPSTPTVTTLANLTGVNDYLGTVKVDARGDLFFVNYNTNGAVYEIRSNGVGAYAAQPTPVALGYFPYAWSAAPDSLGNVLVMVDLTYSANVTAHKASRGAAHPNTIPGPANLEQIASGNVGAVPLGTTGATHTLTFQVAHVPEVPTGVTVAGIGFLTLGAPNKDFAQAADGTCTATTYNSPTVCTINFTFTPTAPGLRRGAIEFFGPTGAVLASVPVFGTGTGPQIAFRPGQLHPLSGKSFKEPLGVAMDGYGNIFVADAVNNAINVLLAPTYSTIKTVAPAYTKGGGFHGPTGLALDGAGNLFVTEASSGAGAIKIVSAASGYNLVTTLGTVPSPVVGIAVDGRGNLFFALPDAEGGIVFEAYASATGYHQGGPLPASLDAPLGLAIDSMGNIFTTSALDPVVQEISPVDGYNQVRSFGTDAGGPGFLALDPAGNVYVADSGSSIPGVVIQRQKHFKPAVSSNNMVPGGIIELTVNSGYANSVDLGHGPVAPVGLTVGPLGNILFSDVANRAIAGLIYSNPPSLSFRNTTVNSLSTPTRLELANIGNKPLVFNDIDFPNDFIEVKQGPAVLTEGAPSNGVCSTTESRPAGYSCFLGVEFAPLSKGWVGENINLADNNLNGDPASQIISVQGTGLGIAQTITFPVVPTQNVNGTLPLAATASSGLPVSYVSVTPANCTVSGTTASLIAGGVCRIKASQAGNTVYNPAPAVYQYFWVNYMAQTVTFPLPTTQHLLTNYTLAATATSGLPVTFWSHTPAICTVSGTTLTPVSVGVCGITASQAGNAVYASATAYHNFQIARAIQTINFNPPVNGPVGAKIYLSASASSGLPVSYTSNSPTFCTVSGNAATLLTPGPCSIQASQAGNATYAAAMPVVKNIRVLSY